jgi:hypothetical protein
MSKKQKRSFDRKLLDAGWKVLDSTLKDTCGGFTKGAAVGGCFLPTALATGTIGAAMGAAKGVGKGIYKGAKELLKD